MGRTVLIINDNLDTGGVERVLQSLVRYLTDRGDRVTLWACNGDRATLARCYPAGIGFRRYPFWYGTSRRFSLRWAWQRFCRLLFERGLLRLRRWDVVIAMKEGESMLLASRLRAGKKLAWIHTDYEQFHWTACLFPDADRERACLKRFDRVVCVSKAVEDSVRRTLGDPGNLCTRYNPIDWQTVRRLGAERPADCVRPAGKTLLVTVGRLSAVKRCGLLLELCARLSGRYAFELWLVGGGEDEAALLDQARDLGLDCVRFLGHRDNPYPYMACADWVLSASASESYGLSIQEALILGTPVLAASCPAIAETLDPRFGLLVGQEPRALEQGLEEILCHPEIGARLRENLRQYDPGELWEPRLEVIRALTE